MNYNVYGEQDFTGIRSVGGGNSVNLKIQRLRPDAYIPGKATEGSAGMDLCACCEAAGMVIKPMERVLIPTGIAIQLPGSEYVGLVFARSGTAYRKGLALANGVGVIDSDYRGEIMVAVVNLSVEDIHIESGDRVAQLLVMPVAAPEMLELEELDNTQRGAGGFGSTGHR